MRNKRSPLKDRPLRNPGQSLDEQIRDLTYDGIAWPLLFAMFLVLLAVLEWVRYLRPLNPSPTIYTLCAIGALGFAGYRVYKVLPRLRALKLGRDGEKAVGQFLEKLREQGYRVFHDVIGNGFNIDHVLIGPAGVFTVETKTRSKPGGDARIVFDGESVRIGGMEPDRDPVVQAKAQASWLSEVLGESTGRRFTLRGVIVYPGWYVDESRCNGNSVWVLEPKRLPVFLGQEPPRLSQEDIQLAAFHLSRFVRTVTPS